MAEETLPIITFSTLIPFNTLIDYCAIIGALEPEVSHQKITLGPNETVIITMSVKDGYYSVEEGIYLYSENPEAIQFSIEIDNKVIVPTVAMLPTEGSNTQKVIFRKGRVKKEQVKITFTNIDLYNSTKVSFQSWIDYITKEAYDEIVQPVLDLITNQLKVMGERYV